MRTMPMSVVINTYQELQEGGRWFDRKTMQFFGTKLPGEAFHTDKGVFFITSETHQNPHTFGIELAFSIRTQLADGNIGTVGEYHSYKTEADAYAALCELVGETS